VDHTSQYSLFKYFLLKAYSKKVINRRLTLMQNTREAECTNKSQGKEIFSLTLRANLRSPSVGILSYGAGFSLL